MLNRRLYMSLYNAKQRCYNKNNSKYKNYGKRGIKVCDEWLNDSKSFYNWAMNNGYDDNLTLDRIDVNGNYEPSNCRWVTKKQQAYNKQNTRNITFQGLTYPCATWEHVLNLGKNTCDTRYRRGWSIDDILMKRGDGKTLYPYQVKVLGDLYENKSAGIFYDMGL